MDAATLAIWTVLATYELAATFAAVLLITSVFNRKGI